MNKFIKEICTYIAANIPGNRFIFDTTEASNLKVGELPPGKNGVFAVMSPSPRADLYTPIQQFQVDFWAVNAQPDTGLDDLSALYHFFHKKNHYQTTNFYVYFTYATGNIEDMDVNPENRKMWRLSVVFIGRYLIS